MKLTPFSSRTLTFVTLAALLTVPAYAQTLELDHGAATINSSGTQVVAGSTAIFGGGASAATSSYNKVNLSNSPNFPSYDALTVGTGANISTLNLDSATATVTGGTVQTTANQENGVFNVQGGSLTQITSTFGATANISAGTVGQVDAYEAGTTNISGGTVTSANDFNDGEVYITGGTVSSTTSIGLGGVFISGGTVGDALASDSAYQSVSGGTVQKLENVNSSNSYISGGTVNEVDNTNYDSGNVHITGGAFQFIDNGANTYLTGTNLQATQTTGSGFLNLRLTGTLTNGDTVNARYLAENPDANLFFNGQLATISPAPVPEASTMVSFGLLLTLGLGGMCFKTRRQRAVNES